MVLATVNVFMLPLVIAFKLKNKVLDIASVTIDMCFLLDIIVVFRTVLIDEETGEEIKNSKIIANKYIEGRFTIDFLSTVPFDYIALIFLEKEQAAQF